MSNSLDANWVNQIFHGDCVELMEKLPAECIPLVVTSPPYGEIREYGGNSFDAQAVIEGLNRIVQPGGIVAWVEQDQLKDRRCSGSVFANYQRFSDLGFDLVVPLMMHRIGLRQTFKHHYGAPEFALVLSKGKPRYSHVIKDRPNKTAGHFKRYSSRSKKGVLSYGPTLKLTKPFGPRHPVWDYSTGGFNSSKDKFGFDHPAIMAEAMAEDLIISFSRPGDLVLDPMVGSGTTAKMAILNHRKFLGFEIHAPYVEIAQERVRMAKEEQQRRMDQTWLNAIAVSESQDFQMNQPAHHSTDETE